MSRDTKPVIHWATSWQRCVSAVAEPPVWTECRTACGLELRGWEEASLAAAVVTCPTCKAKHEAARRAAEAGGE